MRPADSLRDPGSAEGAKPDADASIAALLGRTCAQLENARADVALAARLQARQCEEIEHLERRLQDSEVERLELLDKLNHRDGLLSQIFGSRSWRWTHALRRMLGRR